MVFVRASVFYFVAVTAQWKDWFEPKDVYCVPFINFQTISVVGMHIHGLICSLVLFMSRRRARRVWKRWVYCRWCWWGRTGWGRGSQRWGEAKEEEKEEKVHSKKEEMIHCLLCVWPHSIISSCSYSFSFTIFLESQRWIMFLTKTTMSCFKIITSPAFIVQNLWVSLSYTSHYYLCVYPCIE